jgi:hypothetical protein
MPSPVLSSAQPPRAELMALDKVIMANSLEKTRPRTLSGTHSSRSCVEKVQLTPPPSSTSAKPASGAVIINPITPIPKDRVRARRSRRS